MTRASPSTKLPTTVNKQQITMGNKTHSNANETRTGTRIVGVALVEDPKKRAKMGLVVDIISRIKEAVAVARTTNLSSSRDEVEVELPEMDSPNINRRNLRQASRISHRVLLHLIKVPLQCRQDLLKQDLHEVVWDKTKAQK